MRKYVFPFESVLRFRRHRRDLCRQLLARVLADDADLVRQRDSLERTNDAQRDELRQLADTGSVDVDRAASRRYYIGRLTLEIQLVDRKRHTVAQQLELCRQTLTAADRDVKVLERLEERRRAEHRYESERRAAHALEDTWLAAHGREFTS